MAYWIEIWTCNLKVAGLSPQLQALCCPLLTGCVCVCVRAQVDGINAKHKLPCSARLLIYLHLYRNVV